MLKNELENFLKNVNPSFDECLKETKEYVKNNFHALQLDSNPVVTNLDNMSPAQVKFLIIEYSAFSQDAIHMLLDAMLRNADWPKLFEEIQHNINEEKGEETKGIPHLEIMREGYKKDLGINVDMRGKKPSLITESFLTQMRKIFNSDDNAFSAGALLAFEGVAIQEFHILDKIVRKYNEINPVKRDGKAVTLSRTLTTYYIDGHKEFEIGHEQHLIDAVKPYITKKNSPKMVKGYLSVIWLMSSWWEQLKIESYRKEALDNLSLFRPKLTQTEKAVLGN